MYNIYTIIPLLFSCLPQHPVIFPALGITIAFVRDALWGGIYLIIIVDPTRSTCLLHMKAADFEQVQMTVFCSRSHSSNPGFLSRWRAFLENTHDLTTTTTKTKLTNTYARTSTDWNRQLTDKAYRANLTLATTREWIWTRAAEYPGELWTQNHSEVCFDFYLLTQINNPAIMLNTWMIIYGEGHGVHG